MARPEVDNQQRPLLSEAAYDSGQSGISTMTSSVGREQPPEDQGSVGGSRWCRDEVCGVERGTNPCCPCHRCCSVPWVWLTSPTLPLRPSSGLVQIVILQPSSCQVESSPREDALLDRHLQQWSRLFLCRATVAWPSFLYTILHWSDLNCTITP